MIGRALLVGVGCLLLVLGAVGAVVPLLPSVPFLLGAALCFARSSRRLDEWFRGTRLYRENLEGYVAGRGMTPATKLRVMGVVTLLLAVGFVAMAGAPMGRVALVGVWLAHLAYFSLVVRTDRG